MSGGLFIGGRWVAPHGTGGIEVVNPATLEPVGTVAAADRDDVEAAVAAARGAFPGWAATPVGDRIALVERIRTGIAARADELAALITAQMGAPIGFSRRAQLGLPLADLDAIVAAAAELAPVLTDGEPVGGSLVLHEPIGVVGAITPWNFPLHQIALKVGAALVTGCTVVLKPSELTPLDAVAFAEIVAAAGVPAGVFNLVTGGAATGAALAAQPDVDLISLTGSVRAGIRVAEAAAATITKVTLELGGKSAAILLDDVDLERVVPEAVRACFGNAGQVCAALSRLLVPEHLLPAVEALAVAAAAAYVPGAPDDPATTHGPQASQRQRDQVAGYIQTGIDQGARLLVGGPDNPMPRGAYVAPTVLSGVTPEMTVAQEEIFGPVLSIMTYRTEDEAVAVANGTPYGLSGGVWSADPARALAIARRLRTGSVGINGAGLDVAAPFGGYGRSGIGREGGRYGLAEFLELKTVSGVPAR